jgi:predicted 3-demethylubiquinone-9 3-methyltransferase (glyoxalase superfamily)
MATKIRVQRITPFLWFDHQAEDAAKFYVSIFGDSRIVSIARYSEAAAGASGCPAGSVMTVQFQLQDQVFVALNGGPHFKFSEAISFVVNCEDQKEIDHFWNRLAEGGQGGQCGWLKDKFGVSWQVVPSILMELLSQEDPTRAERVMEALLKMNKLDVASLARAARG